jgi:hypothetical protein
MFGAPGSSSSVAPLPSIVIFVKIKGVAAGPNWFKGSWMMLLI